MWHLRTILAGVAGILLFCFAPGMRADSLQLKNGNFVQGKYLGGTQSAVQFEVNGRIRLYDIDEILSISFAAASADGGVPSNNAERKPNPNTQLNSAASDNRRLRTARWKQTSQEIPASIAQDPERHSGAGNWHQMSPGAPCGSTCAVEPNPAAKARLSAIAARSVRIAPRRFPVLSD